MDRQVIAISLSPEVSRLLADNELDLLTELRKQHLDVTRADKSVNIPGNQAGLKSVELIILASAVAAPLVASAIARVIDALGRNKRAEISQRDGQLPADEMEVAGKGDTGGLKSSTHTYKASFLGLKVELTEKFSQ